MSDEDPWDSQAMKRMKLSGYQTSLAFEADSELDHIRWMIARRSLVRELWLAWHGPKKRVKFSLTIKADDHDLKVFRRIAAGQSDMCKLYSFSTKGMHSRCLFFLEFVCQSK